jgi:hypothetical protein
MLIPIGKVIHQSGYGISDMNGDFPLIRFVLPMSSRFPFLDVHALKEREKIQELR